MIHKPLSNPTLPTLLFVHDGKLWHVSVAGEPSKPVVSGTDLVFCIAYLVWNDLYVSSGGRMTPNPTPVTLQEINNLAKRIRDIFGVFDITGVDYDHCLEPGKMTKMLIVVNFDAPGLAKDIDDICVIYGNHWGELFSRRFGSPEQLRAFMDAGGGIFDRTSLHIYVQRNSLYYEKIIERVKNLVSRALSAPAV
jgi:adenylate cyclase class 1